MMRLSGVRLYRRKTKLINPDHRLFSVDLAVRTFLYSLDNAELETNTSSSKLCIGSKQLVTSSCQNRIR